MTYFTDSPFERMMVQRPRSNPGSSSAPKPPSPCAGCGCAGSRPCVGTCMRELMEKKEAKQECAD